MVEMLLKCRNRQVNIRKKRMKLERNMSLEDDLGMPWKNHRSHRSGNSEGRPPAWNSSTSSAMMWRCRRLMDIACKRSSDRQRITFGPSFYDGIMLV